MKPVLLFLVAGLLLLASQQGGGVASADDEDFYEILGLEKKEESSDQEVKKQFRILSKQYHPDQNPNERERYVKVQRAYEVLSDRKKRKIYDMKGIEGLTQLEASEKNPHAGHMDPFLQMFGMGGGQQNSKGQNMQLKASVPLSDVYNGATHSFTINKQKLCKRCRGTGAASKADFQKCSTCGGRGVTVQRIQLAPGFVQQAEAPCQACGGTGKKIKKKCPECKGNKVFRGEQRLEVEIERGIPDEHQIVFEMEADQSPDLIPGDVIVIISTKPDPVFRRKGNDLETTLKISLRDALLGFSKRITHMDGHEVVVARSQVTQYGTKIRIDGEGMPLHNVPSEKGNLYVILEFDMPKVLSDDQAAKLEKIL